MTGHMAHYGKGYVMLPENFDLREDYDNPQTYLASMCTNTGRMLGRSVRVVVDHVATGTGTPGTGDTVVKRAK